MANRRYSEVTKKALFALSRGRCYEPKCRRQVIQKSEDGIPVVMVDIAHIRAVKEDGPRWDESMTDLERKSFVNLILLCTFHHKLVDRKPTGGDYSEQQLQDWKAAREGDLKDDLSVLTEDDLEDVLARTLAEIIGETEIKLLAAIHEAESSIPAETVRLLQVLIKETFDTPYLDLDAVASLADSARVLGTLPDYAPMLEESSRSIATLPDYAPMLSDASRDLRYLPDYTSMLHRATEGLSQLPDLVPELSRSSEALEDFAYLVPRMEELADSFRVAAESTVASDSDYLYQLQNAAANLTNASTGLANSVDEMERVAGLALHATQERPPDRLTYVLRGMIAGAVVALIMVGIIWYLVAKGGS